MHDLNYFREHLDVFAEMAKKRGTTLDLDAFRTLDKERRELITTTEQLKAQRNKANDEIATLKKATQREFLLTIPNVPHSSVPLGHGAEGNVEVRRWGVPPKFDFTPKPHWEVGERAGILDLVDATKITGARFAVYKG